VIDKIDGMGPIRTAQPVKRTAKTGGTGSTGFAKQLDETGEAAALHDVGATGGVAGVLGIQEVDDALAHASRGKMRAENILDKLEDLRLELLTGAISREKLLQLTRIVNVRRGQITDPHLAAVLDEIDLRAQVELAKYASRNN
jgi:hypothetical protein